MTTDLYSKSEIDALLSDNYQTRTKLEFEGGTFLFDDPDPYRIFPRKEELILEKVEPDYLIFKTKEGSHIIKDVPKYCQWKDVYKDLKQKCSTSNTKTVCVPMLDAFKVGEYFAVIQDPEASDIKIVKDEHVFRTLHIDIDGFKEEGSTTGCLYFLEDGIRYDVCKLASTDEYLIIVEKAYTIKEFQSMNLEKVRAFLDRNGLDSSEDIELPLDIVLSALKNKGSVSLYRKVF